MYYVNSYMTSSHTRAITSIFCYTSNTMAKQKKKRNKKYTGADAATTRPSITKVQAVSRSKVGQWWYERKRIAKPILIAVVVVAIAIWLIIELVRIIANA